MENNIPIILTQFYMKTPNTWSISFILSSQTHNLRYISLKLICNLSIIIQREHCFCNARQTSNKMKKKKKKNRSYLMIRKSLEAGIFHVIRILLLNKYFKVDWMVCITYTLADAMYVFLQWYTSTFAYIPQRELIYLAWL